MDVRARDRRSARPKPASRPTSDHPEPEPTTQPSDGPPVPSTTGSNDESETAEEIAERDHPLH